MATSKKLANLRKSFISAAKNIEKKLDKSNILGKRDISYVKSLKAEAERFRNLASQSYVGRSGTKEERAQRINQQYEKLMSNYQSVKESRSKVTQKGQKAAVSKRERQEKIFGMQLKMRSKTNSVENSIFFQQTQQYWKGAKTPEDRYSMITESLGASNIFEARDIVMRVYKENEKEINLIMKRDWKTLKSQGWTDDEINEARWYDSQGDIYKYIIEKYY